MNQQPILNIKMVPAGVELVLVALGRMPYEQVAGLIAEIRVQAEQQLTPPAEPDPVSATTTEGETQ